MRSARTTPATFADLADVPEMMVGQLIDGEVLVWRRPALPHAHTASNVLTDLNTRFGRSRPPGGWVLLIEPELHLGPDALVPDIAGWRRLPDLPAAPFLTLAPDWVLEVLSPLTASIDRVSKARIYARDGVQWLWFIDPLAGTVEVNRLEQGRWLQLATFSRGEPVRAEPFDEVEFETGDWFSTTSP